MTAALPLALLCGISLASALLSILAVSRVRDPRSGPRRRASPHAEPSDERLRALQKMVEDLSQEVRELRQLPPTAQDGAVRPGLNLNKRSQALRLHRRGDPPDQIATALAVSRQEVDLLLKVHRIVMKSL